jgi:hypothetical protein
VSIRIDLPVHEIAALKRATKLEDEAEAVVMATREFLRLRGLRELKAVSGKIDFDSDWQAREELELSEIEFPH